MNDIDMDDRLKGWKSVIIQSMDIRLSEVDDLIDGFIAY